MLIEITKINPIKDDPRGLAFGFELQNKSYFIVLNRKKETVSGSHYHKGKTKSKNPETFFLAKGIIKVILKDIKTGDSETVEITENNILKIPPLIYHEVHTLTDIILIEFNEEKSDFYNDTVKE